MSVMDRKLAAILCADVVGYSMMMEKDEQGTLERLNAERKELFEPEINRHHGRILKLIGDGLLAEFGSVVDAVECAVSLQRGIAERNADFPENQRIHVRIGINLGEVIVDGEDRYGEGVNVATRLEHLAESDAIYVSGKVAREVERKLAFGFQLVGEQKVKNIAAPIQVFRVRYGEAIARGTSWRRRAGGRPMVPRIVLIVLIGGGAAWYGLRSAPAISGEPSIAVLPFTNMSGDPAQDYLGSGIAEDLITMLSSFPSLRVVSRTSSFVYDKPIKVQQVGHELKVNYVIEGSVRRSGDKVRVTAQLIDVASGEHVWANRYDEEGSDITALQDDAATRIYHTLGGLKGDIRKREEAQAWTKAAPSLDEYDYYLRGHQLFFRFTKEDNLKARAIWMEGLQKFPDSALLQAKIGWTFVLALVWNWTNDAWRDTESAWTFAKMATDNPHKSRLESYLSQWLMARVRQFHDGDFAQSVVDAERAADLVPFDPFLRADLAQALFNAGKVDEAIEWLEEAIRRDATPMDWYFGNLPFAYYLADRPADAVEAIDKIKYTGSFFLAAPHARLGRLDEARAIIQKSLADTGPWTLEKEAVWPSGKQPQLVPWLLKPYLADLAKAGLPEK
jgi:TolB-like protein/class 3 adenylate cyclase